MNTHERRLQAELRGRIQLYIDQGFKVLEREPNLIIGHDGVMAELIDGQFEPIEAGHTSQPYMRPKTVEQIKARHIDEGIFLNA